LTRVASVVGAVCAGLLAATLAPALARTDDRSLIAQLDREVIALRQTIARLERERDACGSVTPPAVFRDLLQLFPAGPVSVAREGAAVTVTFPGDILFTGSLSLREEALPSLDLFAEVLKANPDVRVTVTGHVDGARDPWGRSATEAAVVAAVLVERFGIAPERVGVAALGATRPLTPGDTPEGRALNHRVVMVVSDAVRSAP
jgi:outer membrane protein OmpA-like peptidoglycan-associated protein